MSKILIIEDDPGLRESIYELLALKSHNIKLAEDGFSGFQEAKAFQPDLILSDIIMPRIDGFDVLSLIRSDRELAEIPFIFVSGSSEVDSFRKAMNLGANDFLVKPFTAEELYDAVNSRIGDQLEQKTKAKAEEKPSPSESPKSNKHTPNGKLALPTLDGLELIDLKDLVRCEAQRSYSNFHFANGSVRLVSKSMKTFEEVLVANDFVKVHRSNIVNLKHIKKYVKGSGGYLILLDESSVPVSPTYKQQLLDRL